MVTCKDCIHNKICGHYVKSLSKSKGIDFDNAIEQYCEIAECDNCEYFQNRSKFIELPCELGDKVFYFDTAGRIYEQTIFQFIYGGTGLKLDSDVMFDSELIGKRFFLRREDAEQALKEREELNEKNTYII